MTIRPFSLLLLICVFCLPGFAARADDLSLTLTYLERFKLKDKSAGLTEPSGLSLSHGGNALWTVSDDTRKFFKTNLKGKLSKEDSFDIDEKGLEGVAIDPSGEFLFAVVESGNRIIKLNIEEQEEADSKRLAGIPGFEAVKEHLADSDENKGLEGIAFDEDSGSIWVLKEGEPGLLIELKADLSRIVQGILLNEENGFRDDDAGRDKLDFSGICYDAKRKRLWIVSDKGRRVYLYDPDANQVQQSFALGYTKKGKYREIKKAEGVAHDPEDDLLYVVSDEEARLYVFAIH